MTAKRRKPRKPNPPAQGPEAVQAAIDRWGALCERLGADHPETARAHAAVLDAMTPEARARVAALFANMQRTARELFGITMH